LQTPVKGGDKDLETAMDDSHEPERKVGCKSERTLAVHHMVNLLSLYSFEGKSLFSSFTASTMPQLGKISANYHLRIAITLLPTTTNTSTFALSSHCCP
jgi:hypothetical protein